MLSTAPVSIHPSTSPLTPWKLLSSPKSNHLLDPVQSGIFESKQETTNVVLSDRLSQRRGSTSTRATKQSADFGDSFNIKKSIGEPGDINAEIRSALRDTKLEFHTLGYDKILANLDGLESDWSSYTLGKGKKEMYVQ